MKRFLKISGYALGLLVLVAGLGAGYISIHGVPTYNVEMPSNVASLQVPKDSLHIVRGAKIATLLCNECHKDAETGRLTGKVMLDLPKEFGTIASLNITHDKDHGIGGWTDGELYYFLRTGIHTDGRWSPPYMPKFPLLADDDLYSIIAWLRSDAPSLVADSREFPPNKDNFLVKFLGNVAFFPPPLPAKPITMPDPSNKVAFGRYVADNLCNCYTCHSADFKTMDILAPERSAGYYGGGNPLLNNSGELVPSSNITFDAETGIGNWTRQQFLDAVKYGKNPKGGPLYYPMFPHTTLTDVEVDAVYAFLKTVPPIKNKVNRYVAKEASK
jgi:mono/diheme cytochrome c family protein